MPSVVDQRLSSRFHQWQIAAVGRSDRLASRVGAIYRRMIRGLLLLAAEEVQPHILASAAERLMLATQVEAQQMVANGLRSQIDRSHQDAAGVVLQTVPLAWFARLDPRLGWLAQAPAGRTAEEVDPTEYQYDYEPVAGWQTNPRQTRGEAMRLIRSLQFPPPTAAQAAQWLSYSIGGLTWEDRFRRYNQQDQATILGELTNGITAGENVAQLRQRVLPVVDGTIYRAQRIARTEGRRVAELAQQQAVEGLGDLISGQQINAVMDQWTRSHHAARHGKIYRRQRDGSFVADDGELLPQLPDEPNCRCMATPILEPPEEFLNDPALKAEFENATADVIPDPAAYDQWFANADQSAREAAVGAGRYREMTRRLDGQQPDWVDFVGRDGRLLPADRIRRETAKQRTARKTAVAKILGEREQLYRDIYRRGFIVPPRQT